MKSIEKYETIKNNHKNRILMIKEGIFYKAYLDDAIILWYIFGYKFDGTSVGFTDASLKKVEDKLKKLDLGFSFIEKDKIVKEYNGDSEIYTNFKTLSKKAYDKESKIINLEDRIRNILLDDFSKYNKINNYIKELEI